MQKNIVITVDGPSGAGKGTLCKALADQLQFNLLDSGAVYRVLGLAVFQKGIDFTDEQAIVDLAKNLNLRFSTTSAGVEAILDETAVTALIRTQEVADYASKIAIYPLVRQALLQRQRDFARPERGLIADGRDMGTVVFPEATVKIFLDASAEERAKRRLKQLQEKGINGNFAQILSEIQERDDRDRNRSVAPLVPAKDALLLDSTLLSIEQVISVALQHIKQQLELE